MAAHNPAEYGTAVVKPGDFDKFWEDVLAQAAKIPLNTTLTPVPLRSTPEVEVFEVHYDSLDHLRIAGWYCRPRGATGPLPAMVFYPGYISEPTLPKSYALRGYACFGVAPRGKLRSHAQYNPGYPGLLTHNITDRNTYGYRGFYVDAWRVIDLLDALPEVDGARIGVQGGSQGGALTLLAAAMCPQIAAAAAQAPYLAGMIDAIRLTNSYPYEEINEYLHLHPEAQADVEATLAYFDVHNFVDRIRCPIIVNIGLNDDVCPPETGYAVYEKIGSAQKQLYPYAGHGHDSNGYEHGAIINRFFDELLQPQPVRV
jgi:cephalosporin-C deacetylase